MEAPQIADETTMLAAWLDVHRATLERKCAGLSDEQMRERSVPPSSMSLIGLLRHMFEVERWWFRHYVGGETYESSLWTDDNPDGDFDDIDDATGAETFRQWRDECDVSRRVMADVDSLDQLAAFQRREAPLSVRWIMVHMIEEYARHNGHADLIRERVDGATGH